MRRYPMARLPLSQFIREFTTEIIEQWCRHAADCMPAAGNMTPEELRNHVRELLLWVAEDMESPQTAREQRQKSVGLQVRLSPLDTAAEGHAKLRVNSGFTLEQVVGEFRALRASVLRLRAATLPSVEQLDIEEITRFNESIDQMLSESVARYTRLVEAALRTENTNKNRFLATLSHELRNPLAAITSSIGIMENGGNARQALEVLNRQTRNLTRLLDDLLDIARISSDRLSLKMEPVDVRTCVTDAVAAVAAAIKQKQHHLNIAMSDVPVTMELDATRITQIVTNLLNNAAKYSPAQSTIEVSLTDGAEAVRIGVRDNGAGIAPDVLPVIFDPFAVSRDKGSRDQQGLGLGLAISQRLAGLHAGTLTAHSAGRGCGAEFCLTLPKSR